ncbi:hypothetical protein EV182_005305, partial [Spiromyces aspiralis]
VQTHRLRVLFMRWLKAAVVDNAKLLKIAARFRRRRVARRTVALWRDSLEHGRQLSLERVRRTTKKALRPWARRARLLRLADQSSITLVKTDMTDSAFLKWRYSYQGIASMSQQASSKYVSGLLIRTFWRWRDLVRHYAAMANMADGIRYSNAMSGPFAKWYEAHAKVTKCIVMASQFHNDRLLRAAFGMLKSRADKLHSYETQLIEGISMPRLQYGHLHSAVSTLAGAGGNYSRPLLPVPFQWGHFHLSWLIRHCFRVFRAQHNHILRLTMYSVKFRYDWDLQFAERCFWKWRDQKRLDTERNMETYRAADGPDLSGEELELVRELELEETLESYLRTKEIELVRGYLVDWAYKMHGIRRARSHYRQNLVSRVLTRWCAGVRSLQSQMALAVLADTQSVRTRAFRRWVLVCWRTAAAHEYHDIKHMVAGFNRRRILKATLTRWLQQCDNPRIKIYVAIKQDGLFMEAQLLEIATKLRVQRLRRTSTSRWRNLYWLKKNTDKTRVRFAVTWHADNVKRGVLATWKERLADKIHAMTFYSMG